MECKTPSHVSERTKLFTMLMSDQEKTALEYLSKEWGCSQADVVRKLVKNRLKENSTS